MRRVRRTNAQVLGSREAARIAATLGADLMRTRKRRRLTQRALGDRVRLSQGRISDLERGEGASAPLETWIALGFALDRPMAVSFSRDIEPDEPRDAGHLRAQELVLRLARRSGRRADFELPTRSTDPARVIDVVIRDDAARTLVVIEIWNRLDDLGAAVRSTSRKQAEANGLAVLAAADGPPYRVASSWLMVDTAANRRPRGALSGGLPRSVWRFVGRLGALPRRWSRTATRAWRGLDRHARRSAHPVSPSPRRDWSTGLADRTSRPG